MYNPNRNMKSRLSPLYNHLDLGNNPPLPPKYPRLYRSNNMEESLISGWACLPRDLLDSILYCLDDFHDFILFSSVCCSWRSVALEPESEDDVTATGCCRNQIRLHKQNLYLLKTCGNQLPLLLTPAKDNSPDKRSLYNVAEGVVSCEIQLPIPYPRRFIGSSLGWLFTVDESMVITLVNPFLNKVFHLPALRERLDDPDYDYFIEKAMLLPRPRPDEHKFDVLLLYQGRLAYLKYGSLVWTRIRISTSFSDIISFKGQCYAVTIRGTLWHVNIFGQGECSFVLGGFALSWHTRLVESQVGDLLVVRRFVNEENNTTTRLGVYKMSYSSQGKLPAGWVQIHTIGEQALFLGDNNSLSVSTIRFPKCKPNCIYYDDCIFDIGDCYVPSGYDDYSDDVADDDEKSFGLHYTPVPSRSPSPPSIWLVPYLKPSHIKVIL